MTRHGREADTDAATYQLLFDERIVPVLQKIDEPLANSVMAQVLSMEQRDPTADISVYINSGGGSIVDTFAILDTMDFVRCDVATYVLGQASGVAQLLLSGGTPGKRYAVADARIDLGHVEPTSPLRPEQAGAFERLRREYLRRLAVLTGQTVEQVAADAGRVFDAQQALEYGIVDHIRRVDRATR